MVDLPPWSHRWRENANCHLINRILWEDKRGFHSLFLSLRPPESPQAAVSNGLGHSTPDWDKRMCLLSGELTTCSLSPSWTILDIRQLWEDPPRSPPRAVSAAVLEGQGWAEVPLAPGHPSAGQSELSLSEECQQFSRPFPLVSNSCVQQASSHVLI